MLDMQGLKNESALVSHIFLSSKFWIHQIRLPYTVTDLRVERGIRRLFHSHYFNRWGNKNFMKPRWGKFWEDSCGSGIALNLSNSVIKPENSSDSKTKNPHTKI